MVGVITNACLIAFTSSWGNSFDLTGQLVIVIAFEVDVTSLQPLLVTCARRFTSATAQMNVYPVVKLPPPPPPPHPSPPAPVATDGATQEAREPKRAVVFSASVWPVLYRSTFWDTRQR